MLNIIETFFNNNFIVTIIIYIVLMFTIIVITTLLEKFCVTLKEKKNLSDGLVGGIILGAITSLPEFITCLTSVIETKSGKMGIGDIIGSNSFDLFVLGIVLFITIKMFINRSANSINIKTLACTGAGTIFVFLAALLGENTEFGIYKESSPFVWHGFNFFSILILLSYCMSVFFILRNNKQLSNVKSKPEGFNEKTILQSKFMKLNLPSLISLILITSTILILVAIILTCNATSLVKHHWKMNEGFGGSLLLGVCTSVPEIVACVNLCRHKEYNMTIDTMVGSTSFNLAMLSISNIALTCVYTGQAGQIMYEFDTDSVSQLGFTFIIILAALAYLILNTKKIKSKLNIRKKYVINSSTLSLMILPYIVWIILGFIFQNQI